MTAVTDATTQDQIQWQFVAPRAPHEAGIMKAAVKQFKFHLKKVIGKNT